MISKRRCIARVLLHLSRELEATPLHRRLEPERAGVVAMCPKEALGVRQRRCAVRERLVPRKRGEVLSGGDPHQLGDSHELFRIDPAVGLDRLMCNPQAVIEESELDQNR
ncbi:MAG: hypothetical protein AB7L94_23485 [Kofleriaceae bacterium]